MLPFFPELLALSPTRIFLLRISLSLSIYVYMCLYVPTGIYEHNSIRYIRISFCVCVHLCVFFFFVSLVGVEQAGESSWNVICVCVCVCVCVLVCKYYFSVFFCIYFFIFWSAASPKSFDPG